MSDETVEMPAPRVRQRIYREGKLERRDVYQMTPRGTTSPGGVTVLGYRFLTLLEIADGLWVERGATAHDIAAALAIAQEEDKIQ